ncbi:MAG: hypothetical protein R3E32_20025 [Chitinophagales bacterium]
MKSTVFYLFIVLNCSLLFNSCKQKTKNVNDSTSELTSNDDKENKTDSDDNKGDGYKRYEVKSGIVEYETTGTMNSGKETLYFDDYGRKEAKYTQTTVTVPGMNMKQTSNQLTIMDGDWIYSIDLDKKTGFKMKPEMLEKMAKNKGNDLGKVGKEMLEQMGGKKVGEETVLGKNCEIWEMSSFGTKIWIWNNLSLKNETNMMGMEIKQLATKVETNVSIPTEKFEVPNDITISDENPMEKLEDLNMDLDKLKDLNLDKLKDIDMNKLKEAQEALKKIQGK